MKTKGLGFNIRRSALAAVFSIGIVLGFAIDAHAASITLTAPIASVTVNPGQTATYTVKIARNGYLDKVSFSAVGAPAGTTVAFSPNLTTASSSTMTVTTPTSITAGVYQIKINALETATGSAAAPIFVSLRVNPPPIVTLTATPRSQSIIAGNRAVYEIAFNRNGFTGPINLSVAGLPVGATPSFSYAADKATLTISTSLSIGRTQMFPTVSGTAPGASVTPITLTFRTNAALAWTSSFNLGYRTLPMNVTQDTFGNVIVISAVDTVASVSPNIRHSCIISKYLSDGTLAWTQTLDDLDGDSTDVPNSIVTDSVGNIYVAGNTDGRIDPSIFTVWPVSVYDRWWLAKFDTNGVRQWVRQDTLNRPSYYIELKLDSSQNLIVYTAINRNVQHLVFDRNGQMLRGSQMNVDAFTYGFWARSSAVYLVGRKEVPGAVNCWIMKLDNNDALVWETYFQVDGVKSYCYEVVDDNSGNIFVAGTSQVREGEEYSWIQRRDSNNGNLVWEKRFSGIERRPHSTFLRVHTDGDLLVGTTTSAGSRIEKYQALNGNRQWFRDFYGFSFYEGKHPISTNSIFLTGADERPGHPTSDYPPAILVKYQMPNTASLPSGLVINPPTVMAGAQITMWGNNLSNVEEVMVGTTSVKFRIVSATEIRFDLPNLPSGQYEVSARTYAEYVTASPLLSVF